MLGINTPLKLKMSDLPQTSAAERGNRNGKLTVLKRMTGIKFRLGLLLQKEKGANTFDFCLIACI